MKQFLLLSLLSCTALACTRKADTPSPSPQSESCSYKRDGNLATGHASAAVDVLNAGTANPEDLLIITLQSFTAGNTNPAERILIEYHKAYGAPVSSYQLLQMSFFDPNSSRPRIFYTSNLSATVTQTATGFSGTFSGVHPAGGSNDPVSQLEQGVYTDAHL